MYVTYGVTSNEKGQTILYSAMAYRLKIHIG